MYTCKKPHPDLTVGKQYAEYMPNPNVLNAVVKLDSGKYAYLPRKEFFRSTRLLNLKRSVIITPY